MDAFKAQFERIRQQLAALTATQKMLVTALVAVMILTVLYMGRYASNAEMVPVLNQALTDDDIGPIDRELELAGVPHSVTADKRILVPADRKNEVLANLMFARVLPQDTHSAFETMSKEINPFSPNTTVEMAYNEATAMELSAIISRFPGVANAKVIINSKSQTRIEGSIPPSATVFITTKGQIENPKVMVRAAADGVAHAVSGLTPGQISVILNGASMKVADSTSPFSNGDSADEIREHREAGLEQKIRNEFNFISGMTVTVRCDVEMNHIDRHTTKYNKDGTVVQPQKTSTNSEETSSASGGSGDVGVTSNTSGTNGPVSLGGGGSAGGGNPNTTNTQHDEVTNLVAVGSTIENTEIPAGKETVESATVRVPSSYFLAIYKHQNPAVKDVIDAPAPFMDVQLASIKEGVKNVVGVKTDGDLSVAAYADLPMELAMATGPAVQNSALNTVGGHAKEIGIAVLAIVSLLMMATMVRKSTPAQILLPTIGGGSSAVPMAGLSSLGSGESVAGEVGAGAGALDGMEMDEDSVRTQQMLDQVTTMVKGNPDGAASLVKKWLSRP